MTAELWDRHASTYDKYFAGLTGYIARAMLRMVEHRLPASARILDVACGTGALAVPAISLVDRARLERQERGLVVATDWSSGMLAITERAARKSGADPSVFRCEVQNGEALTYAESSFDAVFSCFGIFLFNDRRAGWREAHRVLAKGGLLVTSAWHGPQSNEMLRVQMAPMAAALPERLRVQKPGGWTEIAEASALRDELSSCGEWSELRTYPFHASIAFGDWSLLWSAMQNNPVMGELLRKCTSDELEAVRRSVFEKFSEFSGGEDKPLVMEAVCNIAIATKA